MKAHEAVIFWTPPGTTAHKETAGEVAICPHLHPLGIAWGQQFERVGGAAHVDRRGLRGAESTARLFVDFHQLVVRDGIDPELAHQMFLVIDEYAESIAPDISGARTARTSAVEQRRRDALVHGVPSRRSKVDPSKLN
jgi:hypothetical protein